MLMMTATNFLIDLMKHKRGDGQSKAALLAKWRGHKWSSDEMRQWAKWQWNEMVG